MALQRVPTDTRFRFRRPTNELAYDPRVSGTRQTDPVRTQQRAPTGGSGITRVDRTINRTGDTIPSGPTNPREVGDGESDNRDNANRDNASTSQVTTENTLRGRRIHFAPGNEELNRMLQESMQDLLGGTNRADIVRQRWESALPRLNEVADERRQQAIRRNVALGRAGSGLLTEDIGDVERAAQRDREALMGRLLAEASNQEVNDRFRSVGMAGGLSDRLYRQDLGEAGFLRGERANQDQLAREAMAAEESRLNMLRTLGFMNNPAGAEQDLMNVLSGQAATNQRLGESADARQAGGIGNALQLLAFQGALNSGGGGGGGGYNGAILGGI